MKLSQRIDYLDAVRGLAACSVLIYHVIFSRWGDRLIGKIGGVFFNGGGAVTIFFVLSGFVLSYKYLAQKTEITPALYRRFAISRVFRLYPAFLIMLLAYYIKAHWDELNLDFWIATVAKNPHNFWEEATLMRGHRNLFFPDWTLGIEMALSLFVPFLILLVRYNVKLFHYFLVAVFVANHDYINNHFISFGFGILIAWHFEEIAAYRDHGRWWYRWRWALFPLVFALYSFYQILRISPPGSTFTYFTTNFVKIDEALLSGIAAALILLYIINSPRLKRWLSVAPLVFIGRISYGIYLSHWFFIPVFNRHADRIMAWLGQNHLQYFALLVAFTFVCSALTGIILYYAVERPFIRLGKRLG